jgi:SAM-dependent methyltransferase
MSTRSNTGQHAHWNGPAGQAYASSQEKRDRDHSGITKALMEWADARPGEHVLDIGCGAGTTTMMLAERVGPTGTVVGIDISGPMISLCRRRAAAAQSTAQFIEGDAEEHRFERPGFDLGFSQLGIMFFADPVAAFRNIRRGLKKRGRIAFACWRSPAEHLWASVPESAARPFLPPSPPADHNAPGRYSLREADRIRQVLTGAGFYAIDMLKQDARTFAGATPEEAAESAMFQTSLAVVDEVTRNKVREAIAVRLAQEMAPDGIYLTSAAWLVRASS